MDNTYIPLPRGLDKLCEVFCGCATTENTWAPVIAVLERAALDKKPDPPYDDGIADALVDWAGLTEHGTSVRYAWLTDEGREALEFFRKYGEDWKDKGLFQDSEGTVHGMGG